VAHASHVPDCWGLHPTNTPTAGNDVIQGTSGDDVLAGSAGDDKISGFDGSERLCGNEGNDTIKGIQATATGSMAALEMTYSAAAPSPRDNWRHPAHEVRGVQENRSLPIAPPSTELSAAPVTTEFWEREPATWLLAATAATALWA